MARHENLSVNKLKVGYLNGVAPVTGLHASSATGCSIATNPTTTDTVTIGSVVYTFLTALTGYAATATAVEVVIGGSAAASLTALVAAINATGTAGTTYNATGVKAHPDVWAEETDGTVFQVVAKRPGAWGNTIATTETFTDGTDAWTAAVLTGGVDGTRGRTGDVIFASGEAHECARDQVWRSPKNHTYFDFTRPVWIRSQIADLTGVAVGTDNVTNDQLIMGERFESHNMGTQTIINPTSVPETGLLCSLDLTDTEGVEYSQGITGLTKHGYIVGRNPAFFLEAKIKIADISGITECAIGFRKAEAYNAFDSYDEMATLNAKGGNITIETIINGATNVETDTTQNWTTAVPATTGAAADAATHTFRVDVDFNGVVTYLIDGAPPTTTAAYTFDTGEVVVPFFQLIHATTAPGAIHLVSYECGYSRP